MKGSYTARMPDATAADQENSQATLAQHASQDFAAPAPARIPWKNGRPGRCRVCAFEPNMSQPEAGRHTWYRFHPLSIQCMHRDQDVEQRRQRGSRAGGEQQWIATITGSSTSMSQVDLLAGDTARIANAAITIAEQEDLRRDSLLIATPGRIDRPDYHGKRHGATAARLRRGATTSFGQSVRFGLRLPRTHQNRDQTSDDPCPCRKPSSPSLGDFLVITFAPGPDNLMVLSQSLSQGRSAGFRHCAWLRARRDAFWATRWGVNAVIASSPSSSLRSSWRARSTCYGSASGPSGPGATR